MKIIAGSILAGLSLLAEVVNEWLHHFFGQPLTSLMA